MGRLIPGMHCEKALACGSPGASWGICWRSLLPLLLLPAGPFVGMPRPGPCCSCACCAALRRVCGACCPGAIWGSAGSPAKGEVVGMPAGQWRPGGYPAAAKSASQPHAARHMAAGARGRRKLGAAPTCTAGTHQRCSHTYCRQSRAQQCRAPAAPIPEQAMRQEEQRRQLIAGTTTFSHQVVPAATGAGAACDETMAAPALGLTPLLAGAGPPLSPCKLLPGCRCCMGWVIWCGPSGCMNPGPHPGGKPFCMGYPCRGW